MILPIVQYGDTVLRKKCAPVSEVTSDLEKLAVDMVETMNDAEGVGLAAPQINCAIQMAVVDVSHDPECITYLRVNGEEAELSSISPLIFINPTLELHGTKEAENEGCLSISDIRAKVRRPTEVKATLPQLDGTVLVVESDGLLARAIQHEVDHLNGVLFTDRVSPAAKMGVRRNLAKLVNHR